MANQSHQNRLRFLEQGRASLVKLSLFEESLRVLERRLCPVNHVRCGLIGVVDRQVIVRIATLHLSCRFLLSCLNELDRGYHNWLGLRCSGQGYVDLNYIDVLSRDWSLILGVLSGCRHHLARRLLPPQDTWLFHGQLGLKFGLFRLAETWSLRRIFGLLTATLVLPDNGFYIFRLFKLLCFKPFDRADSTQGLFGQWLLLLLIRLVSDGGLHSDCES